MKHEADQLRELITGMRAAYARGENAMAYARNQAGRDLNSTAAALFAYNLRAGTGCQAVRDILAVVRPQPDEKCRPLQSFEVASATEWGSPAAAFRPTTYTEVSSADVEKAVLAYQAYASEVRDDPTVAPWKRSSRAACCVAAKPASNGPKLSYSAASSLHSHRRNHPLGKPPRSCAPSNGTRAPFISND